MSGGGTSRACLSRRSFLKTTAGVVAASAVVSPGLALSAEALPGGVDEDVVGSVCCRSNCMNHCELDWVVRDGKLVRTSMHEFPYPEYNRACLKGLSHVEMVYNPDRLKYPMKRRGWSLDDPDVENRGKDEWERIEWDEAIDLICTKWGQIIGEYGASAMWHMSQTGSYGIVNGGPAGVYGRLAFAMGMAVPIASIDLNLIEACTNALGMGPIGTTNAHADLVNAKTIVVWGGNYAQSQIQSWHFVEDAHDAGATLIVVDPTFTPSASQADLWIPLRPGSDGFLACAIDKYLIDEGLADEEFLKRGSMAPFLLKDDGTYLRVSDSRALADGEEDSFMVLDSDGSVKPLAEVPDPSLHGTAEFEGRRVHTAYDELIDRLAPYTLEAAQEVCDVPAETIAEFATIYATNGPAWIYAGFGIDRWNNGYSSSFSVQSIAIIAGQLGKPGASAGYAHAYGMQWHDYTQNYRTAEPMMPLGMGIAGFTTQDIPRALETGEFMGMPVDVKGALVQGANPFNTLPDRQYWLNEFTPRLEMLVVIETRMTDTAMYADILLPSCTWFEESDISGLITVHGFVEYSEAAIEPLYECKTDYEIANLLAEGMGYPQIYGGMTADEWAADGILAPEAQVYMGCYDAPITLDRLKEEKVIAWADPHYIHGAGYYFPTNTGRAQFYCEELAKVNEAYEGEVDNQRWPYFEPPYEAWTETVGVTRRTSSPTSIPSCTSKNTSTIAFTRLSATFPCCAISIPSRQSG